MRDLYKILAVLFVIVVFFLPPILSILRVELMHSVMISVIYCYAVYKSLHND